MRSVRVLILSTTGPVRSSFGWLGRLIFAKLGVITLNENHASVECTEGL